MNKIVLGLIGLLITSVYNIALLFPSKDIKNSTNLSLLFVRVVTVVMGLLAFLSFFIPGLDVNKNIISNIKKHIDFKLVALFTIIIFSMLVFILLAINKGGPISFVIINMNLIIVILYGIIFMKDPYDFKLILAFLIYILAGAFTVVHQNKLKKK